MRGLVLLGLFSSIELSYGVMSTHFTNQLEDHPKFRENFANSDRIVKRMKRIERIITDFDSPSAHFYPPQAE
jgi:hypothetical protein